MANETLTLSILQKQIGIWATMNFGIDRPKHHPVLGVAEEVGELCHAILKGEQGIRGSQEKHEADAKDAIGDIIIYCADVCNVHGWNLQKIVEETLQIVLERNWQKGIDNDNDNS